MNNKTKGGAWGVLYGVHDKGGLYAANRGGIIGGQWILQGASEGQAQCAFTRLAAKLEAGFCLQLYRGARLVDYRSKAQAWD